MKENNVWIVSNLPEGKKTIKTKWIFKIKKNSNNEPERFKARLGAKGFSQKEGIDYNETFAPVVKHESLRLFLAISVNENYKMHHIDISTAFLYGELDEEVYIDPPECYKGNLEEHQVLKLVKALYGLKQAPRQWNSKLVDTFREFGLNKLQTDNCIFYNQDLLVAIYVDDMAIASRDLRKIDEFKKKVSEKFKCKDLKELKYILGIRIETVNQSILLNQKQYIDKLIHKSI